MSRARFLSGAILSIFVLGSIAAFAFVWLSAHFSVCTPTASAEYSRFEKTIAALDSVINLAITLSTTLVGVGAAVLIGFKSGVRLTPLVRLSILIGTLAFAQAALYAVWWRVGVGELWLNECLALISEPRLTTRYVAQFYFFMFGLLCLLPVVLSAALSKSGSASIATIATLVLVFGNSSSSAQTSSPGFGPSEKPGITLTLDRDRLTRSGDAYNTKPVLDHLTQQWRTAIASSTAFNKNEKQILATVFDPDTRGGLFAIRRDTTGTGAFTAPDGVQTEKGTFEFRPKDQRSFVALSIENLIGRSLYQKFSTIQVSVKPAPPRDYEITINNERCPTTEEGRYRVLPGNNTVEVVRKGKPRCAWAGHIKEGAEYLHHCDL